MKVVVSFGLVVGWIMSGFETKKPGDQLNWLAVELD
jgi:hypothetical protein